MPREILRPCIRHIINVTGEENELQPEIYKLFVGTVALLFGSWAIFGYFVIRYIAGTDKKFETLFTRTEDMPAIREAIKWLKDGQKK